MGGKRIGSCHARLNDAPIYWLRKDILVVEPNRVLLLFLISLDVTSDTG